ncbi:MAG TPA: siderophore-interacting protein [Stellaceae bacterium]|nr:siderophore-interacting protein [Stellaceae bacterium]
MSADDVRERPPIDPAVLEARRGRPWSLRVVGSHDVTRLMRRVELTGDNLDELTPRPGQEIVLQIPQDGTEPARRHYTIRRFDRATKRVDVDFVLHDHATPGVEWARHAKPGDAIDIRGPRGRIALAPDAAWNLFSGDETALPAIFALAEALPKGAKARIFLEIADEGEKETLHSPADVEVTWLLRNGAAPGARPLLVDAVAGFKLPSGKGHAFILGETSSVRARRHDLLGRGMDRSQIYSEGYWRPGRIGGHDHVED